jgi:uncharacterized protein YdaU (DUF1376 family)
MAAEIKDWFPLYMDLWKGESVRKLSMAARGVYLDMLLLQFSEGSIPKDLALIARLIGCYKEELENVWPEIQDKFRDGENGRIFNPRMAQIRHEQEEKSQMFRESGSNGAKKRWAGHKKGDSLPNSPPKGRAKRPPNSPPNSKENKSNTTPNGVEADASDTSTPYGEVNAVLNQVADKLEWTSPTPSDVKKHLKPDSNIRSLIQESSIDEAVALFVFAWRTWSHPPTWSSVYSQRNQLRDLIKGRTNGNGAQPSKSKAPTPEEIANVRR